MIPLLLRGDGGTDAGREGWREMGTTECLLMINELQRLRRARRSLEAQSLLYLFPQLLKQREIYIYIYIWSPAALIY